MTAVHLGRRAAITAMLALPTWAASAVQRPLRMLLPFSAGSGPDALLRLLGEAMSKAGGYPVLIDNRPGAKGWLAAAEARRASADGSTLLLMDNTSVALHPLMYPAMPFQPQQDFEPVVGLYSTHFFIAVAAQAPWANMGELIAAARAQPGRLNHGSTGQGSPPHLGAAMLEAASGTHMNHVPYKDMGQIYTDLAAGRLDWAFGTVASAGPLVKAGRLRWLALAAPQRLASQADVPTAAESLSSLRGFELKSWVALYTPKGVPSTEQQRIQAEATQALATPRLLEFMASVGFTPWPASPSELRQAAVADQQRFATVLKTIPLPLD